MKALRVAALGLVVAACLLAAVPAAQAGIVGGDATAVLVRPGEWFAGWVVRLATWLGWGGDAATRSGKPHAVRGAHGCIAGPDGTTVCSGDPLFGTTDDGDHGCVADPNGVPRCSP